MSNMDLWNRVFMTDPAAVKPITGKQYSGNSPKPYWVIQRLTEEFGPCGSGWGFQILNERMERLSETDVLHIAVLRLWYKLEGERCELEQIGQTKAVYAKKDGSLLVDEDAPKKSVTDALVKCASYLGFAGDIFSGRWDDSKYVNEARDFYEEKKRRDSMTPEQIAEAEALRARGEELDEMVSYMIECHESNSDIDAIHCWYLPENWSSDNATEQEERKYVWSQLKDYSKLRATIKANKPESS